MALDTSQDARMDSLHLPNWNSGDWALAGLGGGHIRNRLMQKKQRPPSNQNELGIDRNAKDYAARVQDALLRQNWDYAQEELEPLLNRLQYMYNNPQGEQIAVANARDAAGAAFDSAQAGGQLGMQMQGISLTPAQQASYDKATAFRRNLATGGAAVQGARGHQALRDQIATGI